jgi:hypothetical protein
MTNFIATTIRTPAPLNVARDAHVRHLAVNGDTASEPGTSPFHERVTARVEQLWDELGDFA